MIKRFFFCPDCKKLSSNIILDIEVQKYIEGLFDIDSALKYDEEPEEIFREEQNNKIIEKESNIETYIVCPLCYQLFKGKLENYIVEVDVDNAVIKRIGKYVAADFYKELIVSRSIVL